MSLTSDRGSVAVVLGTRPEVVKLAGLIQLLGPRCRLIHTGQHYDDRLAQGLLEEFEVVPPHVSLTVGGTSRGRQVAETLLVLDDLFERERPDVVVVQGDTNSTLGGALAANAHAIPLVHIEAGMRSFDRRMAEEHNRILTDHASDVCCAPTEANAANLVREGIPAVRIAVTGHTVVAAVEERLPDEDDRAEILLDYGLEPSAYAVATFHRAENVDDPDHLDQILAALGKVDVPVVLPLHPRTRRRVEEFGLGARLDPLVLVEPLDYATFLALCAESALLITD
ncbi:MAG: non-hydrolyzing UDP-N-acetylglucosamine 2-epimerase, partial [Acidimicrobiia bacterium]